MLLTGGVDMSGKITVPGTLEVTFVNQEVLDEYMKGEEIKLQRLSIYRAQYMGYSMDKRKRRRQHRSAARDLIRGGTLLNGRAPVGSTPWHVAQWHLFQARNIK